MTDILRATEQVREFAQKFRSVIELADAVEGIGQLDVREKELTASVAKLTKQRDRLTAANAEVQVAADAQAAKSIADASAKAGDIVRAAQAQADKLVDDAKDGATKTNAAAKKEAQSLVAKIDKLKEAEADLDRDIAARRAELDGLDAKLQAAREAAARLLS